MRTFILIAALATAIVYTAHAMPSSSLATHRAFDDVVNSVTYVSHPSHHRDRYHRGKKGGKGEEEMTLGQAVRRLIHLTAREEQEKSIVRWEKKTKQGREGRSRTHTTGPEGSSGSGGSSRVHPSHTSAKSLATPYSTKIPDSTGATQAAYARHV